MYRCLASYLTNLQWWKKNGVKGSVLKYVVFAIHVLVVLWQPSGAVDSLDAKIERLVRDWNNGSDMLFSIHPADGSLLIWSVGFTWVSLIL